MNKTERSILVVTCFGHMMSHYNTMVFPALVLPLAKLLDMDMAGVLGLSFWMYLLFGVTALPWGLLGDRWSGKALLLVMFGGAALSGLAGAWFINSPAALSAALAGLGLFSGIYHPIGMGLISKGIERLSVAMGYNAVFGGLGLVLAPLVTGVINWLVGPRAALAFVGVLNLAGLALMAVLPLSESPSREKGAATGGSNNLRAFVLILLTGMLGGLAFTGSTVVLPAYLELKSGDLVTALSSLFGVGLSGNLLATCITAAVYCVGMMGQYAGGHAGERFEPRYAYLVFHLVCIPTAFIMGSAQNLPLIGLAMVYFFFMLGMQAIENTLVAKFAPPRILHSAFGLKFILTFGVGSLAVKMVQWIKTAWGIDDVFPALGVVSVILVALIGVLIRQTTPPRPRFS